MAYLARKSEEKCFFQHFDPWAPQMTPDLQYLFPSFVCPGFLNNFAEDSLTKFFKVWQKIQKNCDVENPKNAKKSHFRPKLSKHRNIFFFALFEKLMMRFCFIWDLLSFHPNRFSGQKVEFILLNSVMEHWINSNQMPLISFFLWWVFCAMNCPVSRFYF